MNKKIALVTGASRGIGAAIVAHLQQEYFIVGTATSEQGAVQLSTQLGKNGTGRVLNMQNKEQINHVAADILSEFGAVDILVNNAGITQDGLFMVMSDAQWEEVLQTNLSGIFYLTRALIKPMIKKRWGRIINISSVVAATGNPGQSNYAAAKAGLEGFSRSLARELAKRNITVNVIAPGFIVSSMTAKLSEKQQALIADSIPMARLGKPEDVAHATAFLAQQDSGYITGCVLPVNGGLYM